LKKKDQHVNLLDLIPVQNMTWVENDEKFVILLKPKFSNRLLANYILPKMKRPNYKINLDKFGTAVWHNCNGKNTVAEIGEQLKRKFGDEIEPVYERLGMYIQTLAKNKFIYYLNYSKK